MGPCNVELGCGSSRSTGCSHNAVAVILCFYCLTQSELIRMCCVSKTLFQKLFLWMSWKLIFKYDCLDWKNKMEICRLQGSKINLLMLGMSHKIWLADLPQLPMTTAFSLWGFNRESNVTLHQDHSQPSANWMTQLLFTFLILHSFLIIFQKTWYPLGNTLSWFTYHIFQFYAKKKSLSAGNCTIDFVIIKLSG